VVVVLARAQYAHEYHTQTIFHSLMYSSVPNFYHTSRALTVFSFVSLLPFLCLSFHNSLVLYIYFFGFHLVFFPQLEFFLYFYFSSRPLPLLLFPFASRRRARAAAAAVRARRAQRTRRALWVVHAAAAGQRREKVEAEAVCNVNRTYELS
jgi:hypothetical protein